MALRIRRGTSQQRTAITPASGELVFDTSQTKLYVGNGSTLGGVEIVAGVIGGNLGSDINLNNFNIGGTGNINITGAITASGTITANGNIILGNQDTDSVSFGADVNSNIVPNIGNLTIGTEPKPWQTVYVGSIENTAGVAINSTLVLTGNTTSRNIVPDLTNSRSLGNSNTLWSDVHATVFQTNALQIINNNILSTESNANINITANGTGSVVTNKFAATNVNVGSVAPMRLEEFVNGLDTVQLLHYFYNPISGNSKITEVATQLSYTQLATNTFESYSIGTINSALSSADDITVSIVSPTGSQLLRFAYLYAGGVGQINVISDLFVGVKPVTAVGLRAGSQTIIDITFNNVTAAGTVYTVKVKQTLFANT